MGKWKTASTCPWRTSLLCLLLLSVGALMPHASVHAAEHDKVSVRGNITLSAPIQVNQFSDHNEAKPLVYLAQTEEEYNVVTESINYNPQRHRYTFDSYKDDVTYLFVFLGKGTKLRNNSNVALALYNCDPVRNRPPQREGYTQDILTVVELGADAQELREQKVHSPWLLLQIPRGQLQFRTFVKTDAQVRREYPVLVQFLDPDIGQHGMHRCIKTAADFPPLID